jgi:FkbM family methyltransferase
MHLKTIYGDIQAYPKDLITSQIRRFGNHTRPEFAFATSILNLGDKVFDLGAHIGTFTLPARHKIGSTGQILAVEGNPRTFQLLCSNVKSQRIDNIDTMNIFVGAGEVGLGYEMECENSGAGHVTPGAGGLVAIPLDQLVQQKFEPDYIKIDVEGFEFSVLSGSSFVNIRRPVIYMEVSESSLARSGASTQQLNHLMNDLGYRFFRNVGKRNWKSDLYKVKRVESLASGKFFDVLCVQKNSELEDMLSFVSA